MEFDVEIAKLMTLLMAANLTAASLGLLVAISAGVIEGFAASVIALLTFPVALQYLYLKKKVSSGT